MLGIGLGLALITLTLTLALTPILTLTLTLTLTLSLTLTLTQVRWLAPASTLPLLGFLLEYHMVDAGGGGDAPMPVTREVLPSSQLEIT